MKLSLEVLTPGKGQGKVIPVTLSQFVIGRDPQCHLRPASAVISKRHCALLIRGDKVFVRDFDSTNGTFVNDEAVKGEREVKHNDRLKAGPLAFAVKIEATVPISKPTPAPTAKAGVGASNAEDDAAAAMLLSFPDDETSGATSAVDSQGVPTGSTVMEILTPMPADKEGAPTEKKPDAKAEKAAAAKAAQANTSTAAKAILEKYMRRPRT